MTYGPYARSASLERDGEGRPAGGTTAATGYYYLYTTTPGAELEEAGPFDDELDCELAMRRADLIAEGRY